MSPMISYTKSKDEKKCVTVRPTSFDPAPSTGGSAEISKADAGEEFSFTKFIKKRSLLYLYLNSNSQLLFHL